MSLDTDTPREAVTHFEVERLWPEHALLRVRLETGRMHQIRVHLAAVDLPVVGDPVYGVRDARPRAASSSTPPSSPSRTRSAATASRCASELPADLAGYLADLE